MKEKFATASWLHAHISANSPKIIRGVNLQIYLEEESLPLWRPHEIIPLLLI